MNNSKIALEAVTLSQETPFDVIPQLREREQILVRIIEAIRELKQTAAWSTLKSLIFDDLSASLKRDLLTESRKDSLDPLKISKIAGQLKWSERFSDLDTFEVRYTTELTGIRKQLHG